MATNASSATPNLGLSQWAADDYIRREDFNADNAAIDAALASAAVFETGSYVGAGVNGSANPNTLTFTREPKLVFVQSKTLGIGTEQLFLLKGATRVSSTAGTGSMSSNTVVWNGNTLSWYNSHGSVEQLNDSGYTYFYVALC